MGLFRYLMSGDSRKSLKKLSKMADRVEALAPRYEAMSDAELRGQTELFRERLKKGETLDDILYEAFAALREASGRVLNMKHFHVQIMGGICLYQGRIAEMKTGEGKTFVATLPSYLEGLSGKGVHIVTVNDYLARRDAEWMGKVHKFMGLTVGVVVPGMDDNAKRAAYACDITYGTNNEFGFDYLRDNLKNDLKLMVQRELNFVIVDEVDSILIDEARTPLIISGKGQQSSALYERVDQFVRTLKGGFDDDLKDAEEQQSRRKKSKDSGAQKLAAAEALAWDYVVERKEKQVRLTEYGAEKAERFFGVENIADLANASLNHHIQQALKAHNLFHLNEEYIINNGEIVIVDEFTGRLMIGRRYSDGLHQAIEAKEHVKVEAATQTFATITLQNYFRMYHKLAGMTGTAETEASEFWSIYKLDVVVIPTNRPVIRDDRQDLIYKTKREKYNAVIEEIVRLVGEGRPVLVGTTSVEISELLSRMLKLRGIKHNVLNAKQHALEAQVVAEAGRAGQVTIATNMAGRGTDIKLTPEVKAAGGLAIIGTERHESRRVDRQLRGRAGRQGDPGSSQFFVSLEDDLMRLFGSGRIAAMMDRMGLKEGEVIQAGMMTKAIERAQKKVEENNFGIRKRLLEYDDVMNSQREVIYSKRRHALMGERIGVDITNMIYDTAESIAESAGDDYLFLQEELLKTFAMDVPFAENELRAMKGREVSDKIAEAAIDNFKRRMDKLATVANPVIKQVFETRGSQYENILVPITDGKRMYNVAVRLEDAYKTESKEIVKEFEKRTLLFVIDDEWKEHLRQLDELRNSVQNASYEQKDPLLIYKLESFGLFKQMLEAMNRKALSILMRGQIPMREPDHVREAQQERRQDYSRYRTQKDDSGNGAPANDPTKQDTREPRRHEPIVRQEKKVGRNDPCPCGSGKKYKNCHGKGL